MLVLGMLQKAQWEQQNDANPTPWGLGAFYIDSTNPLEGVPRIYDGTSWKTFLFDNPANFVTQNSGKDVTIDWSTSVNQKVILTDNCVIRFTNPQDGKLLTLVIVQKSNNLSGSQPWLFTIDMPNQEPGKFTFQPDRFIPYGGTRTLQWQCQVNAVASNLFLNFNAARPVISPSTVPVGMDFDPTGQILTIGRNASPFNTGYMFDPDVAYFLQSGWKAKDVIAPANIGYAPVDIVFDPLGRYFFIASNTSPYIAGFTPFLGFCIAAGGFANPGTLPTGAARCIDMYPGGDFVGVGHTNPPFMSVYPIAVNGAGYGTKLTDPGSLPVAQVNGIAWSPHGDFITVASQTTPFIETYPFIYNGSLATFGAKLVNPPTLPAGGPGASSAQGKMVKWRPQGDFIAMCMSVSPYIYVVPFNRATGTYGSPLTVGSSLPAAATGLAWSKCGTFLFVSSGTSPYMIVYDFSNFDLNTTIGVPIFGVALNGLVVHPMNRVFVTAENTATIGQWSMPWRDKTYFRVM